MNDAALAELDAETLRAAYRARSLSPVEVVSATIARIDAMDGLINAFVTRTDEHALADARRAEAAYRDGTQRLLEGVPYSIKDLAPTVGIPTGYGSLVFRDPAPVADAPFVERLRASGGALLGKTTTPEHGYKGDSDNPLNGPCRNPHDTARTAGGSSGGAAAAAAACFGPLHHGSDGAGSIRIPAAFCGVVGLKPTFGLVAHPPGEEYTLSHNGPIARTVRDAALLLDAMAGFDERDRFSVVKPLPSFRAALDEPLPPLRIAFSPDLGYAPVEEGVARAAAAAARTFAALGHAVEEVELGLEDPWWIERELWAAMFAARGAGGLGRRDELSPGLVSIIEHGLRQSGSELAAAIAARAGFVRTITERLAPYDLLLTPAMPCVAFPLGSDQPDSVGGVPFHDLNWTGFAYPFNMTGAPACSVPCGSVDGLPVGLQIVGKRLADALVLRAAGAFEAASR